MYCISNLFSVSITTTVTMFVKNSSLNVVKPQLSLTLRGLFSVKNNNNICNNVCKRIKSECGDYTFPKPQLSLSELTIRSLNAVASSSPPGRFSCRLQGDDEGLLFSPSWSQKAIVMGFPNPRGGTRSAPVMNISTCSNWQSFTKPSATCQNKRVQEKLSCLLFSTYQQLLSLYILSVW